MEPGRGEDRWGRAGVERRRPHALTAATIAAAPLGCRASLASSSLDWRRKECPRRVARRSPLALAVLHGDDLVEALDGLLGVLVLQHACERCVEVRWSG